MTIAPNWLDELYAPSAIAEKPRALNEYAVEALGTLWGGVHLVSQLIVGAFTGIAFLAFAWAAR